MPGAFALPVAAAPIVRGDIAQTFDVTSTVTPLQQASLSSVISGNVIDVAAQIGQRVHKGELLVKIDDSTLRAAATQAAAHLAQLLATYGGGVRSAQANLASAKVAYETAERTYQRDLQLFFQGFVAKADLDQARSQAAAAQAQYQAAQIAAENASLNPGSHSAALADIANARAALQQIQAQIAQTNVAAPFDGVVTARNVDPGTLASPGTVLMQVAQLDPVFVDAGISGDDLPFVHVGTPATVTVAAIAGRAWHAAVAYLNLAAAPGSLTYQARVQVPNSDLALRGGMVATVSFVRSHKTGVLLAPRAALVQTQTGYSLYVVAGGKAQAVPVDVGITNDRVAEVSGPGLRAGQLAILNPAVTLQPGMPVQIIPAGKPGTKTPTKAASTRSAG